MKISVALTTHNGDRFLREQLDSLYSQTMVPDEVVVCDDCSTDHTMEILDEYAVKYGLRYYRNEPALGVNANFFRAISLCDGDYVCICDQDDVWMPHKIKTLVEAVTSINRNDVPVAVSSLRQDVDAKLNPICPPQQFPYGERWEDTLLNTEQSQGSACWAATASACALAYSALAFASLGDCTKRYQASTPPRTRQINFSALFIVVNPS